MNIQLLTYQSPEYGEMLILRNKVLREPLGLSLFTETDLTSEVTDLFVACFNDDNVLVGCCVLSKDGHEILKLRQMAVDSDFRAKGIGQKILLFAEKVAKEKGYTTMMLHARMSAVDFYRKANYCVIGEEFIEVGIPHVEMEKELYENIT